MLRHSGAARTQKAQLQPHWPANGEELFRVDFILTHGVEIFVTG